MLFFFAAGKRVLRLRIKLLYLSVTRKRAASATGTQVPGCEAKNRIEQGKARRLSPTGPGRTAFPSDPTASQQVCPAAMPVGTPRPQAVPRKWELLTMAERRNAARVRDRAPATVSRAWMTSSPVRTAASPVPGRRTVPALHMQTRTGPPYRLSPTPRRTPHPGGLRQEPGAAAGFQASPALVLDVLPRSSGSELRRRTRLNPGFKYQVSSACLFGDLGEWEKSA